MPFQRFAALAAIRYYKEEYGKSGRRHDRDYLNGSLKSTMPPSPVSVNEVHSPEALIKEVNSGNALTYGQAQTSIPSWQTLFAGVALTTE